MRIIEVIVTALLRFLVGEAAKSNEAVDAPRDLPRLRRAGKRIRAWMRSRRPDSGGSSDADRPGLPDQGVRDDWERVEAQRE